MRSLLVPESARIEKKFISESYHANTVFTWLKLHPALFRETYAPRWVNSIYFETHDYTAYSENLIGLSQRIKLRFRWYGDAKRIYSGSLELKYKRNNFGWKERAFINGLDKEPLVSTKQLVDLIRPQLNEKFSQWLNYYSFPVLMNRYHRRYFVSRDQKYRVTVDLNYQCRDLRFEDQLHGGREGVGPDLVIVELKFQRSDYSEATELLSNFPIRGSRHSKYVTGLQMIS